MKHTKDIFKTLAFFAAISLTAVSCGDRDNDRAGNDANRSGDEVTAGHPEEDQKDLAEDHNDAKFDRAKEKDAEFAVDAAMINLREVEASNVAVTKARSAEVKNLARTMVTEHQKAYDELKALAERKSITIPAVLGEDEVKKAEKLANESADDFDRKYTDLMVDEHKKAIDKFEKAAKDCEDADLRAWAGKMLPGLRHHLDMAMNLKEKTK